MKINSNNSILDVFYPRYIMASRIPRWVSFVLSLFIIMCWLAFSNTPLEFPHEALKGWMGEISHTTTKDVFSVGILWWLFPLATFSTFLTLLRTPFEFISKPVHSFLKCLSLHLSSLCYLLLSAKISVWCPMLTPLSLIGSLFAMWLLGAAYKMIGSSGSSGSSESSKDHANA